MTSREMMLTEQLRMAEREASELEEFGQTERRYLGACQIVNGVAPKLIAQARERVINLQLELADACPSVP